MYSTVSVQSALSNSGTALAKDGNPGMPETGDLRIDTYFAEIDEL